MKIKEKIEEKLDKKFGENKLYEQFKEDYGFRTLAMTLGGALVNVVYAVMNGASGLLYSSLWYGAFAGYYLIIALQRIGVIFSYRIVKKKSVGDEEKLSREKEKIYLINGAILVPLDIALGVIITVMFFRPKPVPSGDIMAIASAVYTTYKITMAIRNLLAARHRRDFLIQTVRNIGIIDALASLIILQTTLINTFSEEGEAEAMRPLMAISSFVVCAFAIGIGAYMIIKGAKALGPTKEKDSERKI